MNSKTLVIYCSFSNENELHSAFMPFIKGGGLFVRTNDRYHLEDSLILSVKLMNESCPYVVDAKVVWITPKGAQRNKPAGIGLQLLEGNVSTLLDTIKSYLGDRLNASLLTDTI